MRRTALALLLLTSAACTRPDAARVDEPPAGLVQRSLESEPSGRIVAWRDADGGSRGTVQPIRTFRTASGYCREYALTISRDDGSGRSWREIACRDADGTWREVMLAGEP